MFNETIRDCALSEFFKSSVCLTCGLCCRNTEMILLHSDISRLTREGYSKEGFLEPKDGFNILKNTDGYCVFYDTVTGKCRVYHARPVGCRLYPLIFDEKKGVMFDEECPLREYFVSNCVDVVKAVQCLVAFLEALRREYGYSYNKSLLYQSINELLSRCGQTSQNRASSLSVLIAK